MITEKIIVMNEHKELRSTFKWGQNYDKNNNKMELTIFRTLDKISDSHLVGICIYFTDKLQKISNHYENNDMDFLTIEIDTWCRKHKIFLNEMKYRLDNNIKVKDYAS